MKLEDAAANALISLAIPREANAVVSPVATVEQLFVSNHGRLVQFLSKRLGGDTDRASDIAQEAYLRIVRYADRRDGGAQSHTVTHPRAFLYRVAQNVLADERRRDRVRRTEAQVCSDQVEIAGQEPNQEMVLQGREELAAVEAAACALPPRCRQVFFLSRFEGMSNAAVARRLGISVSMVEQHIVRAMWEIRQNVKRSC